ncbi:phosphoserine phosphatase SerB [Helicobacter baculiformis]|uniref:Phosphoserine phosphatase n=1 Tax=Helicobacter baculiformis TaxID=427351 RepID=A0A1M4NI38_9HELI|nr:phosphoserine phosphatase SerB [Helicobacter baculiformis]SFZ71392.1 OMP505 [Helicobacter baculiformis]
MKLAVFDFDSTLVDAETLEILGEVYGVGEEAKSSTMQAMEGKSDFYESLISRVALLKGMDFGVAKAVCEDLPLHKGAQEVVQGLQRRGYKVVCFSGGFKLATAFFKDKLGLDADFSNTLHTREGVLEGRVSGPMMRGDSKFELLSSLQQLLGVRHTIVVGDGANDVCMFGLADVSIAFNAKEIVRQKASIVAQSLDLREILEYVKS